LACRETGIAYNFQNGGHMPISIPEPDPKSLPSRLLSGTLPYLEARIASFFEESLQDHLRDEDWPPFEYQFVCDASTALDREVDVRLVITKAHSSWWAPVNEASAEAGSATVRWPAVAVRLSDEGQSYCLELAAFLSSHSSPGIVTLIGDGTIEFAVGALPKGRN